jgi:ribonuclease PH
MTASGGIVEIQGTAEKSPFSREMFNQLLDLAESGINELLLLQRESLSTEDEFCVTV